jgi:hypothetical protein
MAGAAFQPTSQSVTEFLTQLADPQKRADSKILVDLLSRLTGHEPVMWHPGIVGFGQYHYKYDSGREGDSPLAAFSPRKTGFSIYLDAHDSDERRNLLSRLGPHRMGKGCLYVKRLDQIDVAVLERLIAQAVARVKAA